MSEKGDETMILEAKYTLSNGVEIPQLGLGTWLISNENAGQAVKDAVKIGYRHIDTAQAYDNEKGVGEGVRGCGVNRADLFVTTKLAAEVKSYEEAVVSIDMSLKTMGLDYIDMRLFTAPSHGPNSVDKMLISRETVTPGERLKKHTRPENFVPSAFPILKKRISITSLNPAL